MSVSYRDSFDLLLKNSGGSSQVTGAYSVGSPGKFYVEAPSAVNNLGESGYVPGSNYDATIFSINLVVAGEFSANGYGDGPILVNGIKATIEDDQGNELYDFLDGGTINSNVDWYKVGVNLEPIVDKKSDDAHLNGTTSFLASYGDYYRIFPGNRFVLTFQDDFSIAGATNPMLEHSFALSGVIVKDI